jgi:hypothetical protein
VTPIDKEHHKKEETMEWITLPYTEEAEEPVDEGRPIEIDILLLHGPLAEHVDENFHEEQEADEVPEEKDMNEQDEIEALWEQIGPRIP